MDSSVIKGNVSEVVVFLKLQKSRNTPSDTLVLFLLALSVSERECD